MKRFFKTLWRFMLNLMPKMPKISGKDREDLAELTAQLVIFGWSCIMSIIAGPYVLLIIVPLFGISFDLGFWHVIGAGYLGILCFTAVFFFIGWLYLTITDRWAEAKKQTQTLELK